MAHDVKLYSRKLEKIFSLDTKPEWFAFDEKNIYSPRLDIAVGQNEGKKSFVESCDAIVKSRASLLDDLIKLFQENVRKYNVSMQLPKTSGDFLSSNRKMLFEPRCFLAIEIDYSGNRKQRLAGTINVCTVGFIGLIVAHSTLIESSITIAAHFTNRLHKIYDGNLLIINVSQFEQWLAKYFKS